MRNFDVFDDILHVDLMRVEASLARVGFLMSGDVKFSNNPRLKVVLTGAVIAEGKGFLTGSVVSEWVNAFGVEGLTLVESGVSVGLGDGSVR